MAVPHAPMQESPLLHNSICYANPYFSRPAGDFQYPCRFYAMGDLCLYV